MEVAKLSIVIVNCNNPDLIDACLRSIDRFLASVEKEVIVIDNNSKEQSIETYRERYPYLRAIYLHENMGFGYANNVGVKNATGEILLLLNSDTEFVDGSFQGMLEDFCAIDRPQLLGPRLIWPDGRFQQSYSRKIGFVDFLTTYTAFRSIFKSLTFVKFHKYYEKEFTERTVVDVIYGTAILIRKSDYERLGGFAKKYFMYFEDVDFCDRFMAVTGGEVIFDPATTLIHRVKGSDTKGTFNVNFTKSKYSYGIGKFGFLSMVLVFPIDLALGWIIGMVRKLRLD